jgi:hypothetical protein
LKLEASDESGVEATTRNAHNKFLLNYIHLGFRLLVVAVAAARLAAVALDAAGAPMLAVRAMSSKKRPASFIQTPKQKSGRETQAFEGRLPGQSASLGIEPDPWCSNLEIGGRHKSCAS